MKRLRLETTTATVTAAKERAALLDRYGATSMVHAPIRANSVLERLKAAPPRSERAAKLGLQWLAETYPAFGANFIPVAPELVNIVRTPRAKPACRAGRAKLSWGAPGRAIDTTIPGRRSLRRAPISIHCMVSRCARSLMLSAGRFDHEIHRTPAFRSRLRPLSILDLEKMSHAQLRRREHDEEEELREWLDAQRRRAEPVRLSASKRA